MRTYREVMCPVCKKKYMTYVYKEDGYEYSVKKKSQTLYGWIDKCPKCNTYLFVADGELDGLVFDEIPETDIQELRRGISLR